MASVVIPGGGITPKFKWQGWSNGEKYQNPKKFLKPPTNIPTQKNPMPNFRALKICRMYWILKEPQNTEQLKQVWFYTILRTTRLAYADLPRILRLIWICPNKIPTWIKPTKTYCQIFLPKKSRNQTQKSLPDQSLVCSEEGLAGSKRHLLDPPTRASRRNVKIGFFLLWTEFLFWTEKSL